MNSTEQTLLTPAQVAAFLQVNERTVTLWLRNGYLRGYKLGKEWRIAPQALQLFLDWHANMAKTGDDAAGVESKRAASDDGRPAPNVGSPAPGARRVNGVPVGKPDSTQSAQERTRSAQGYHIGQERRRRP